MYIPYVLKTFICIYVHTYTHIVIYHNIWYVCTYISVYMCGARKRHFVSAQIAFGGTVDIYGDNPACLIIWVTSFCVARLNLRVFSRITVVHGTSWNKQLKQKGHTSTWTTPQQLYTSIHSAHMFTYLYIYIQYIHIIWLYTYTNINIYINEYIYIYISIWCI